jgi:adenylate cyclase
MAQEIERKFLLKDDSWRAAADAGSAIMQGYLVNERRCSVRIRVRGADAWITVKGPSKDLIRPEFEYSIPVADADAMLTALAERPFIEKTRYLADHAGHRWEIDEFAGANAGLIVAEIELSDAAETFVMPPWVGEEVSDDVRYLNAALVKRPFCDW